MTDLASGAAYDAIAPRYDRVPVENRINAHLRRLSLARLLGTFPPGSRVLDVGCGTGEEALELAARGVAVVGIDPSPEMVRLASAKARARGLGGLASFLVGAARDLAALAHALGPPFQGAYASFSLAYELDLAPVARALRGFLPSGARFLASVPSRTCLAEWVLSVVGGRPGYAGRRLRPTFDHKVGDRLVPIRAYTPQSLARSLAPYFALERWEGLAVAVPPAYMNRVYARYPGAADAAERIDAVVRAWPGLRSLGDHILAEFRAS